MVSVRQAFPSAILSVDDDPATQSFSKFDYVFRSLSTASKLKLSIDNPFANCFPGDHYRLLAGLFTHLIDDEGRVRIVDVGTHYGTGTRVMLDYAYDAVVDTFDVLPWNQFETTYLLPEDFVSEGGRLTQFTDNLKDPEVFEAHRDRFAESTFIMCDGPKDGEFEQKFLSLLSTVHFSKKNRWLFLDDIRFESEVMNWRRIQSPKLDLTSFGHFSGSGLVDISEGFKFA